MRIESSTTITIHTYENLLAAWKSLGPRSLVARIVFAGSPLCAPQIRRLPKDLRELLEFEDDSFDFLEHLYQLQDPRD